MNGVDGVRAVNKYIPFACGGGVYTYIFVYHVFTIFSDPFNESFYEITTPKCLSFGSVIGCFSTYEYMYLGTIGALTAG